ncbi:MAG: hypothetical protein VW016_00310, partial [Luminiphilus sp.]
MTEAGRSPREWVEALMPAMLWHEGIWTGSYRHLGEDNSVLDQHQSRVVCEFPTEGEAAYRQTSSFN